MRNVGLALAAAGAAYADIVKITTYVVNYKPEHRVVIGLARAPFFSNGTPPASTLVGVSALALPDCLVEIETVAVVVVRPQYLVSHTREFSSVSDPRP